MYHHPVSVYRIPTRRARRALISQEVPPVSTPERMRRTTRARSSSPSFVALALIALALAIIAVAVYVFSGDSSILSAGFFLHIPGVDPRFGEPFADRASAHAAMSSRTGKHEVSYIASDDERAQWQHRERERFYSREYIDTPWTSYGEVSFHLFSPCESYPTEEVSRVLSDHFAHISRKQPGMIAYTPTDEHGYQDRQVTIRPGRYLEQFFSAIFTKDQRDAMCEKIRAYSGDLKIARTASDIVQVYRRGPGSCMSHDGGDYSSHPHHPVEVYGDSDLGIAYLGDLDKRISARCIVWPDRKVFGRLYGDDALRTVLENHGYSHEEYFDGARVRVLTNTRGRYVLPYVDVADYAHIVTDDKGTKWFELTENYTRNKSYNAKETNGLASGGPTNQQCDDDDDDQETYYCAHCGDVQVDDDGDYCSSCEDERYTCTDCNDEVWGNENVYHFDGEAYCESCYDDLPRCPVDDCGEVVADSGEHCYYHRHHRECTECDEWFDHRNSDDPDGALCDDCYVEPVEVVAVVTPFVRTDMRDGDDRRCVAVVFSRGLFAVTRDRARSSAPFVVTHIPTGMIAYGARTDEDAITKCRMLATSQAFIDWTFDDPMSAANDLIQSYLRALRTGATTEVITSALRSGLLPIRTVRMINGSPYGYEVSADAR